MKPIASDSDFGILHLVIENAYIQIVNMKSAERITEEPKGKGLIELISGHRKSLVIALKPVPEIKHKAVKVLIASHWILKSLSECRDLIAQVQNS